MCTLDIKGPTNQSNRDSTGNNGSTTGTGDKDSHSSLTPSPRMPGDDVKSEPMELVCGSGGTGNNNSSTQNALANEEHSNDSVNENHVNHTGSNQEIKGHLR